MVRRPFHWFKIILSARSRFRSQVAASLLFVGLLLCGTQPVLAGNSEQSVSVPPLQTSSSPATKQEEPKKQVRSLPVKKEAITFNLAGEEKHFFTVKLKTGELLRLTIEQKGIDVSLVLYGPEGQKLVEVDSPNGTTGPEPLAWIAETSGSYQLEIRATEKGTNPGSYVLQAVERRAATDRDRKLVQAALLHQEAQKLRIEATEKSRREAIVKFEATLPLWHEAGETAKEANALYWIGRISYVLKDYPTARTKLSQALVLLKGSGNDLETSTLLNLGFVETASRKLRKALEYYKQALSACRAAHCDFEATILESTGASYNAINARDNALEAYQQAALLYRQANSREDEARVLNAIGGLQSQGQDHEGAAKTYAQLITLRQALKDHRGELSALIKHAQVHIRIDRQKALKIYQEALLLVSDNDDAVFRPVILSDMGFVYQGLGDQPKALELFNQALPLVTGEARANLLTNIAVSHVLMGDRQTARDIYQQAFALMEGKEWKNRSVSEAELKSIDEDLLTLKELASAQQELSSRRLAKDPLAQVVTLERVAAMHLKLKEPRKAQEDFSRLATLFKQLVNNEREADTLNKLGLLQLLLQDEKNALTTLGEALKIRRAIGDKRDEAEIYATITLIGSSLDRRLSVINPTDDLQSRAIKAYQVVGDSKAEIALVSSLIQELWLAQQHLKALNQQNLLLHQELERRSLQGGASTQSKIKAISTIASLHVKDELWQKALEKYNELLPLQREVKDLAGEADTLGRIGYVYYSIDDHRHAMEFYDKALALRRQLQDPHGMAEMLVAEGITQNWLGNRIKALELFEQALPLGRESKDERGVAVTLFRIGEVYHLLGEKQKALDHLNQALALTRTEKDKLGNSAMLEYLGLVYISLGQPEKAQEYYKHVLTKAKYQLDLVRAGRTTEFGKWLADDSQSESAGKRNRVELYMVSVKRREGSALADLGDAYYRLEMKPEALASFNQALPLLKDAGYTRLQAQVLNKVGLLYSSLGDDQRSLDAFSEALALRRADGNRGRQAEALHNIATVYESLGEKQKALENYSQALTIRREVKDKEGEGETLDRLMRFARTLEKKELAIFYGKQAVNSYQQLRSNIQGLDQETQKSFLTTKADTYRQLADLLITSGRLPEAQQVLDLLKKEEYLDFVRGDAGGEPDAAASLNQVEAALLERYKEIENRIIAISEQRAELGARERRTPEEEQLLKQLERDIEAANVAFEKFLTQLPGEFTNAEKGEVKAALKAAELRATQELSATLRDLGPSTVLLYTVASPDKYHVILFTSETSVAREYSISAAELNRKIHQFRVVLRNPAYDPLPLAQELYRIIVGPVAKDLEATKAEMLMWELDGPLRYLPIAALHDGKQYMVESYRNSVFTPASQSRLERPPSERWRGLGLGVSKGAVPLPFVAAELRGIIRDATTVGESSGSGVIDGRIMLDDSFTKDAMKSALNQSGGFSLVHIASHFVFKPGNETDSYLLLGGPAPDSDEARHFTLAEIKRAPNLFRGVELLTLSACNTAVGDGAYGAGAEVENFGVLAQLKGARAVIATLWRVNDMSTMSLMKSFYRLHNESPTTPKIEALRQAQLALLRGDIKSTGTLETKRDTANTEVLDDWEEKLPRFKPDPAKPYAHPYYWAPFILIGNWR